MFKPSTKEQWMGLSGVCESTILFAASFASSATTNSSLSALLRRTYWAPVILGKISDQRPATPSDQGRHALPRHLSNARSCQDICQDRDFQITFWLQCKRIRLAPSPFTALPKMLFSTLRQIRIYLLFDCNWSGHGWGVADQRPRAKSATSDPRPQATRVTLPGQDICKMPDPALPRHWSGSRFYKYFLIAIQVNVFISEQWTYTYLT